MIPVNTLFVRNILILILILNLEYCHQCSIFRTPAVLRCLSLSCLMYALDPIIRRY